MWPDPKLVAGRQIVVPKEAKKTDSCNVLLALLYGSVEDIAKAYDDYPVMAVIYGYGALTEEQRLDAATRCPETLLETLIHRLSPEQRDLAIRSAPIFAALQVFPYLSKEEIRKIFDIIYEQKLYEIKSNISVICACQLVAKAVSRRSKNAVAEVTEATTASLREFTSSSDINDFADLPAYLANMTHFKQAKRHHTARTKFRFVEGISDEGAVRGPVTMSYLWELYIPPGHLISEHHSTLPVLFNPFILNEYVSNIYSKADPIYLASIVFNSPFSVLPDVALKTASALVKTEAYTMFRTFMRYSLSAEDINKLDSLYITDVVDSAFAGG